MGMTEKQKTYAPPALVNGPFDPTTTLNGQPAFKGSLAPS